MLLADGPQDARAGLMARIVESSITDWRSEACLAAPHSYDIVWASRPGLCSLVAVWRGVRSGGEADNLIDDAMKESSEFASEGRGSSL